MDKKDLLFFVECGVGGGGVQYRSMLGWGVGSGGRYRRQRAGGREAVNGTGC